MLLSLGSHKESVCFSLEFSSQHEMRLSQIVVEGSRVQLRDFMSTGKLLQMTVEPSKIRQLCSSLNVAMFLKA